MRPALQPCFRRSGAGDCPSQQKDPDKERQHEQACADHDLDPLAEQREQRDQQVIEQRLMMLEEVDVNALAVKIFQAVFIASNSS